MESVGGISGCADVCASEGIGLNEARDSLLSAFIPVYVCNHSACVNSCQAQLSEFSVKALKISDLNVIVNESIKETQTFLGMHLYSIFLYTEMIVNSLFIQECSHVSDLKCPQR